MSNLDDFDRPPEEMEEEEPRRKRKQSLGKNIANAWQASPVFKIFLLLVGGGAIASAALGVFNSDKPKETESAVQSSGSVTATPGGEAPPAFQEAVNQASNQRAQAAQQQGGSAFPTPMGNTTQMTALDPGQQNSNDPLAEFRAQQEAPNQPARPQQQQQQQPIQTNQPRNGQQQQANGEPALDQNLAQAMQQQMQALMNGWKPENSRVIKVTSNENKTEGDQNGGQQNGGQQPFNPGKTLIQAGTINYGQMILEANSDVPGPIMAQILSGPFSGARAIGRFQTKNNYLVIQFNLVNYKGKDYPVDILALDPDTTLGGLATETDQRWLSRVLIPAAAEFVSGFADGFTQQDQNVIIADGVVVSERARGSLRRGLGQGAQEAGDRVSNIINQQAAQIRPLVKVAAGTPIGLFFTRTVTENTRNQQQVQTYPGQGGIMGAAQLPGQFNPLAPGQGFEQGQTGYGQVGGGYGLTGYEGAYNPYSPQNSYNSQAYGINNAYGPLNNGSSSATYGNGITVVPANGGATFINPR